MVKSDDSAVFLFTNILTAMVFAVTVFLSSAHRPHSANGESLLPHHLMATAATGGTDYQKMNNNKSTLHDLTWKRGLSFIVCTVLIVCVICFSILDLEYTKIITVVICLIGGFCFGIFLLSKAFSLLLSAQQKGGHGQANELYKDDAVIGCISLIYVDFGFVLLLFLFVMLGMIKAFSEGNGSLVDDTHSSTI